MSKPKKPREWWLAIRGSKVVLVTDPDEIHQARLGWAGWRAVLVREVLVPLKSKTLTDAELLSKHGFVRIRRGGKKR